MTNPTLALKAFDALTQHSTAPRILQTAYMLLAASTEVHEALKPKYLDRASECFARCGYRLPENA